MTHADAYDYELPESLIAQHPLPHRVDARLMVVDRRTQSIRHQHVRDLPELLQPHDLLVLNNSRVIPARLVGYRTATGGRWQGLFIDADAEGTMRILSKTRGKLHPGETVTLEDLHGRPHSTLKLLMKLEEGQWAARFQSPQSPLDLIETIGRIPLPHYIRGGEMQDEDRERYQTVYAHAPGSVAAPTAGLHFTDELLRRLARAHVDHTFVTLHVGIGTFRPIATTQLEDHVMHREWGEVGLSAVEAIRKTTENDGRIIAVGTTSVRVLETAAKAITGGNRVEPWRGETDLFIRPPYQFSAVDGLLTNFHLPKSTLLVLVQTFGGRELLRRAYREAIHEEYRFFSYGDAMLIV